MDTIQPSDSQEIVYVIAKGRIKDEPLVAEYVKNMLEEVGVRSGIFNLIISTKIKSGGIHHEGIEIKDLRRNAVRLTVQYGDNGTRFECFLSSPEIKPSHLYDLLTSNSKIKAAQFQTNEGCREIMSLKSDITTEACLVPKSLVSTPTIEQKISKLKKEINELKELEAGVKKASLLLSKYNKEIRGLEISITEIKARRNLTEAVIKKQELVIAKFLLEKS